MFNETFLKQRDLFNNMKDKQMLIDYIVYNVDLILVKLINLYRDYNRIGELENRYFHFACN